MDKTLFNSTLPVIITDLQQASSHFRADQTAARQAKSTPMESLRFTAAYERGPTRGSLDSSSSRDSLASSSSLAPDVDPEIRLENSGRVD
jgi:outer membrane protein TolC